MLEQSNSTPPKAIKGSDNRYKPVSITPDNDEPIYWDDIAGRMQARQAAKTATQGGSLSAAGPAEIADAGGALLYPDTVPMIAHQDAPQEEFSPEINFISPGEIKDQFSGHLCPGYGTADATCGHIRNVIICQADATHDYFKQPFSCGKPACPVCWPVWAKRAQVRISATVKGYAGAAHTQHAPRHVTLSPPRSAIPENLSETDQIKHMLKAANKLMDALGVTATAVIIHPYRIRKHQEKYCHDMSARTKGKQNRYQWALNQENWREYLYFSPHLHLLCYGLLANAKTFEQKTGWIYRNHGARTSDLDRTVYYLLTHAWVRGNSKTVRYWREMSSKHLACIIRVEKRIQTCKTCGAKLLKIRIFGDEIPETVFSEPQHDFLYALEIIEHRKYFLRRFGDPEQLPGMPPPVSRASCGL